jgi:membrane-associated phospholipid phosphatase
LASGQTKSDTQDDAFFIEGLLLLLVRSKHSVKILLKNAGLPINFKAVVYLLAVVAASLAHAQDALPDAPEPQFEASIRNTPRNILHDQAAIWTSPIHFRLNDLEWFIPLAAATGAAIATDQTAMNHVISMNPSFNNANVNVSNVLIGGFIASPVAVYGIGHFKNSPHAREAGILSGEAMLDGVVVEQGIKLMFWQERPGVDNSRGRFFESSAGVDSAFPSSHSVIAWAAAAELAGEYPSRWKQLLLYSAATGVSLTRVLGQEHFPSDVVVGGAAGWLVGHYVYRKHQKHSLETSTTR